MKLILRRLVGAWLVLVLLVALEFGLTFLPLAREARPLILIPAVAMAAVVAVAFMQIGRGPAIVRVFAAAGLLWLTFLLVLGSLDPMTRVDYSVETVSPN
jgi:cytochrome c oxidase subunit IV